MSKKQIYLAGGMEKRMDNGRTWRRMIQPKLEEIGYKVFNPCLEEHHIFEKHDVDPKELSDMDKGRNLEVLSRLFKDIVKHDLTAISNSAIMVVYYDESVNMSSGTVSEMTIARMLGMPVLCIKGVSYKDIPCWTIGCIDVFFPNIDDCVDYIKKEC